MIYEANRKSLRIMSRAEHRLEGGSFRWKLEKVISLVTLINTQKVDL